VNIELPRKSFEVRHEAAASCNDENGVASMKQTRVTDGNDLLPSTGHQRCDVAGRNKKLAVRNNGFHDIDMLL
jgi:hypothetical protein